MNEYLKQQVSLINDDIDNDILKWFLWYSPTKESPYKRNNRYDGMFKNVLFNELFATYLLKLFSLKEIKLFSSYKSLSNYLESHYCESDILFFAGEIKNIFPKFIDYIRNSLAHGIFICNENYVFINQKKVKNSDSISFYFKISKKSFILFKQFINIIESSENEDKLITEFIKIYGEIESLLVEKNYKFKSVKKNGTQINQLKQLINNGAIKDKIIFINDSTKLKQNNLYFKEENVKIITTDEIFDFFKVKDKITIIKKIENEEIKNEKSEVGRDSY